MNGLLLIDKPIGCTSHDVVARTRRAINMRAIGHAGTLDPFATGLLILCIGTATRLSEYLIGETKVYTGRMKLGERTNTDDLDGEVIERRPVRISPADLQRAAESFKGEIMQTPPQYSAIQIGGQRAYKMARQGEVVDIPARQVRIDALELALANDEEPTPETESGLTPIIHPASIVDLRVTCTAGTYIRALARDIGEMLGCGAHLTALRRVQSGAFRVDEAAPLNGLVQAAADGHWQQYLLPMDRAVLQLPAAYLDVQDALHLVMGQAINARLDREPADGAPCRVYDAQQQFIAIGLYDAAHKLLRPLKVFHGRE
ncbi:MAG TPA: tRNA pseudouridine(55) synthase TruB [Anaerolineae bacterium]